MKIIITAKEVKVIETTVRQTGESISSILVALKQDALTDIEKTVDNLFKQFKELYKDGLFPEERDSIVRSAPSVLRSN